MTASPAADQSSRRSFSSYPQSTQACSGYADLFLRHAGLGSTVPGLDCVSQRAEIDPVLLSWLLQCAFVRENAPEQVFAGAAAECFELAHAERVDHCAQQMQLIR